MIKNFYSSIDGAFDRYEVRDNYYYLLCGNARSELKVLLINYY